MGTRSTTKINDEQGDTLVTLYRQFDGYPTGHGQELADFLNSKTLINGFGDSESKAHANGMGCLAALLISHLKGDKIGNVYVTPQGDFQEYNYTVYSKDNELALRAEDDGGRVLYDGLASEYVGSSIST